MSKVISYSLWGNNPMYLHGANENIRLQKEFYPGWVCRFYVDETVPEEWRNEVSGDAQIVLMPKSDGYFGMFWRFLPLEDPDVERFVVRDADSRLGPRERDAVDEWEESGKSFHLMRDHLEHGRVPICGGMWGATGDFSFDYVNKLDRWLENNPLWVFKHKRGKYFYADQIFLQHEVWPRVINSHIAHERYETQWAGDKRAFRVENPDGTFIGQDIKL